MARKSTIDRLPEKVRDLIGRLRDQGATIDEILDKLGELDISVSRAALGRHTKEIDELGKMLRESRAMAIGAVEALGADSDDRVARTNVEIMQALVMKTLANRRGENITLDSQEAMFFASTLQKLSATKRSELDLKRKIEEGVQKKAVEVVESIAKRGGLSDQVKADLKAGFLGIGA